MKKQTQKPNYFDTPQLRRQRGDNFVKWMSHFVMPKVFKHIKKYEKRERQKRVK